MQAQIENTKRVKFRGSGYAWILAAFRSGKPFTVRECLASMQGVGIIGDSPLAYRRASDCITRMQKSSLASESLQVNYANWIGTLKRAGKNQRGENLYCVTRRGKTLGEKIAAANESGINLRQHHIVKRIDKQLLSVSIPKRGYFRTRKVYDPLQRTKAVKNTRRA